MRKLFLQFYLTVVTSFLFSVLVVGAIYKNVVQNTTQRYLVDIFETSLYLILVFGKVRLAVVKRLQQRRRRLAVGLQILAVLIPADFVGRG